jgi:hypothetical protein
MRSSSASKRSTSDTGWWFIVVPMNLYGAETERSGWSVSDLVCRGAGELGDVGEA